MRKELDEALVKDFPDLYADRHGDMRETAMCWGFSCDDGWEPIIRKLSEQLTFLSKAEGAPVRAVQVKEKYGSLRFYVDVATDIMYACIAAAERSSEETCEVCGDSGRIRKRGWLTALCARHAYENKRPLDSHEAKKLGVSDHIPEDDEV